MKTRVSAEQVDKLRAEIGRLNTIVEEERVIVNAREKESALWNILFKRIERAKNGAEAGFKRRFEKSEDRLAGMDYGQFLAYGSVIGMVERAGENIAKAQENISLYRQKIKRTEKGGVID